MSYCHMIAPILSYKVCSSVSSLFPVCNCGLILYRKKEVMTRIINKLIRVCADKKMSCAATGRGRPGKRKTPVRNARNYHLCLSRLKNFVEILGVQVFALMQKMLLSEHL
jgi:uncharacterized protein (DUF111 family)